MIIILNDERNNFNDFIADNPHRSNLLDNKTAKKVYDFINTTESIWKMNQASEQGKPAILPLVEEIKRLEDDEFLLSDFNKQSIGAMATCILKPFD